MFLTPGARAQDDNLLFVRERLLRDETEVASLLDLYGKVRAGKRVAVDETQPLIERLRLSGIVRAAGGPGERGGRLVVRNRIYERVFDRNWIADHLPGAELRRQRAAYRRGLARAAAAAAVVVAGMGFMAGMVAQQAGRAAEQASRARVAEAEARTVARRNSRLLYDASMTLVQQAWDAGNIGRVRQLLVETRDSPDRGFEWYYWLRQSQLHLRTLRGPRGRVQALAFSPDGRRLVTGSRDQTAVVWDLATGHKRVTFTGHISQPQSPGITSIAWSPNGRQIVSVGGEGVARVWSPADGRELFVLRGHQARSAPISFSRSGDRILTIAQGPLRLSRLSGILTRKREKSESAKPTGTDGGSEAIWDAARGRLLRVFSTRSDATRSMAGSPDGRHARAGSERPTALRTAGMGDAANWPLVSGLPENAAPLAFSRDGGLAITAGNGDGTAYVWDTRTGHSVLVLTSHTGWVRSAAFSPDGRRILTGGSDATARVWDAHTGRQLFALQPGRGYVSAVAFSPNGQRIATASDDGVVRIWDANLPPDLTLQQFPPGVFPLPAFTPGGTLVVARRSPKESGSGDRAEKTPLIPAGKIGWSGLLGFSPDGRRFATGSWQGVVTVRDAASGRALVHLAGLLGDVRAVAFSPDGRRMATVEAAYGMGAGPGVAAVWDLRTGRRLLTLQGHSSAAIAVAYSPDGRRILTAGGDEIARLWDAVTGRLIRCLAGHHDKVLAVAFSPDGQWIATGAQNGEAAIWNARTGEERNWLTGHQQAVVAVRFSPDGQRLATASDDQTIKLWDAGTGREILSQALPERLFGRVTEAPPHGGLVFAPDGRRLLAYGSDRVALMEMASPRQVATWEAEQRTAAAAVHAQGPAAPAPATGPLPPREQRERAAQAHEAGFIQDWLVLAPIPWPRSMESGVSDGPTPGARAVDQQQLPHEAGLRPRPGEKVRIGGRELIWTPYRADDYWIDFNRFLGKETDGATAYAVCYLTAPATLRHVQVGIGSDDQAKVYLDGRMILDSRYWRSIGLDQDLVPDLTLTRGRHRIVFKVVNETGDWSGCLRFLDQRGFPVRDLKVSLTPSD